MLTKAKERRHITTWTTDRVAGEAGGGGGGRYVHVCEPLQCKYHVKSMFLRRPLQGRGHMAQVLGARGRTGVGST